MHWWATLNPLSLKQLNDRIKHPFSTSCKIIFATKQRNFCRDQPQSFETTLKLQKLSYSAGRNKQKNIVSTLLWYRQETSLFGVNFDEKKKKWLILPVAEKMRNEWWLLGNYFGEEGFMDCKRVGIAWDSVVAPMQAYRSWMENYTAVFLLSSEEQKLCACIL